MRKTFILDTNILLHDPNSLYKFQDNNIILPLVVIEELDEMKRRQDEVGRNARKVARMIDEFRQQGKIHEGVSTPGGGTLKVELRTDYNNLPEELTTNKTDNRILSVAIDYNRKFKDMTVILVSKDTYLRIKADAVGVKAENYFNDKVDIDELYSGNITLHVSESEIDNFYQMGYYETEMELNPNQFVTLISNESSKSALGKYDGDMKKVVPLRFGNREGWGIKARNKEQRFAMELLFDDNIKLITLVGQAGTGKTLLAVAAGLQKVIEEETYKKLLITRPVVPLGNDIGFLPGDKDEKLRPWMAPIFDNLEYILHGAKENKKDKESGKPSNIEATINYFKDKGQLELEAITYIRGRTIPNQYIIVDEAQNLTPHEVKTILTRAGEGSKIILTGDPHQVDHPYLDSSSNGLTFIVEKFKGQKLAGHITFVKGERSDLAELAAAII